MVIGPIPFDMLMRPVKYVEGGGLFVAGLTKITPGSATVSNKWALEVHRYESEWKLQQRVEDTNNLFAWCGAYGVAGPGPGTPTFILAGRVAYTGPFMGQDYLWQGYIYTSTNEGKDWSKTHTIAKGGYCYAAGWNETTKRFYVQCITEADLSYENTGFNYTVLSSSSGANWAQVESNHHGPGFGQEYASPLLQATGNPVIKDTLGQVVPNGSYYGWDKGAGTIIVPQMINPYSEGGPGVSPTNIVDIWKRHPQTGAYRKVAEKTMPEMLRVNSVGFSESIWQVAGTGEEEGFPAKIASSTDNGNTWDIVYRVTNGSVPCIMGKP